MKDKEILDRIYKSEINNLKLIQEEKIARMKEDQRQELEFGKMTTADTTEDSVTEKLMETSRFDRTTYLAIIGLCLSLPFAIEGLINVIAIFHL